MYTNNKNGINAPVAGRVCVSMILPCAIDMVWCASVSLSLSHSPYHCNNFLLMPFCKHKNHHNTKSKSKLFDDVDYDNNTSTNNNINNDDDGDHHGIIHTFQETDGESEIANSSKIW